MKKKKTPASSLKTSTAPLSYSALECEFMLPVDLETLLVYHRPSGEILASYSLREGVFLTWKPETKELECSFEPPTEPLQQHFSELFIKTLQWSFAAVSISHVWEDESEDSHVMVTAGHLGIVDIIATDPIYLTYLSYPLGMASIKDGVNFEIFCIGIKKGTASQSLSFEGLSLPPTTFPDSLEFTCYHLPPRN